MDAIECITTRKSIRGFKADPLPRNVIEEIISTAQRSPSYKNSQPWEVAVVSGQKKEELTKLLIAELEAGKAPSPDIAEPKGWPPAIDARISSSMAARGKHLGIDITDPSMLGKAKQANFRFYGAPHVLYLYQDASLPEWSIFDMGLFAETLMLVAHAKGVGTVPQAFVIDYSEVVRKFLGLPEGKRLVLGISMGWPDMESHVNKFESARVQTGEIVKWVG